MDLATVQGMPITSFRDLQAWQLGMDLAVRVYTATAHFPADERFGLAVQTRRAAVSIPSNVAEGQARPRGAFINHLTIALGSHAELETLIALAVRLDYLTTDQAGPLREQLGRTGRCIQALHSALRRPPRGR
jgi:four helix bundle protein